MSEPPDAPPPPGSEPSDDPAPYAPQPAVPSPYAPAPPPPVAVPVPVAPASERVRLAYLRRAETDYLFDFWTAFGWTILTCGVYSIYIVYQLVRRDRDHNLRRLELLEAANALAWERANAQGHADELEPHFTNVAMHLQAQRSLTREFRDPVLWCILTAFATAIVEMIVFVLTDQDLVKHDFEEGGAENELAYIYTRLGTPVAAPDPAGLHAPQNHVGRIIVSIITCGIYTFFWLYDVMRDGNEHFAKNWAWEDSLAQAVQTGEAA